MLNYLKEEEKFKTTENGAVARKTSDSFVLDYFAQGSALRNRDEKSVVSLFTKAFNEDALLTLKVLFNSRDIRGGQGERKTFRTIIKYLAKNNSELMNKNIHLIPEFGRWDDLYCLFGTSLQDSAISLIRNQLTKDLLTEHPSNLAKWLKSENTSSGESKRLAKITREALGMTPKQYRKTLSSLRKKIDIIETKLTEGRYDNIDYSKIPSKAGLQYRKAFFRNDEDRYLEFIDSLSNGTVEKKINVKTLYPYEIIKKINDMGYYRKNENEVKLLDGMWKNLPDYIGDDTSNTMAVVDVSGSMNGTPMDVAVSLGLYLAEKNKGIFGNHFITFSSNPQLVEVRGKGLYEKVLNMERADWGMSTNIKATFDLLLNTAIAYNVPQEEVPERIVIISDMEFDSATSNSNEWYGRRSSDVPKPTQTLFKEISEEWNRQGYKMPKLVFWNVDSRNDNMPMKMDDNGVVLVSGASPNIFESVLKGEYISAYDLMLNVINKERYDCITV